MVLFDSGFLGDDHSLFGTESFHFCQECRDPGVCAGLALMACLSVREKANWGSFDRGPTGTYGGRGRRPSQVLNNGPMGGRSSSTAVDPKRQGQSRIRTVRIRRGFLKSQDVAVIRPSGTTALPGFEQWPNGRAVVLDRRRSVEAWAVTYPPGSDTLGIPENSGCRGHTAVGDDGPPELW
jgi:hypothetical protein